MPDYLVHLNDRQRDELRAAAERAGMTPEQFASRAVSAAVDARYVLPKAPAAVLPFQALKKSQGDKS